MKYSLVTTCMNEIIIFPKWQRDVLNQTKQPDEIVIVDSESNDGTWDLIEKWSKDDNRVVAIKTRCTPAQGRNLAVTRSSGDIVVSTDLGCRLDHNWFNEITNPFINSDDLQVVAGNYLADDVSISSVIGWADYYLNNGYQAILDDKFLPSNRSVAYTRAAWNYLGGLPENLTFAGDDTALGIMMRSSPITITLAPGAIVFWERSNSLQGILKEKYRYGFGNGELGIERPYFTIPPKKNPFFILWESLYRLPKKQMLKGIIKSIKRGKYLSASLIPFLYFACSSSFTRGLISGYYSEKNKK